MNETDQGRAWGAGSWVLLVAAIGLLAGVALAFVLPIPQGPVQPGAPPPSPWIAQLGVISSALSLSLLAALLWVYARSLRTTRAPYLLGLVVFLVVLLIETAVSSPFFLFAFGLGPGALGRFLTLGGFLMSAALAIFLYLTLQ